MHLDLLVAQRIGLEGGRRLHRHEAEQLEQVVLEEVAAGAGLLVERAAPLDPDRLGHRDLHVVDVAAVPDRLEDAVAEPEDQQVPDGLLAQVVVDAVDLPLPEDLADLAVEADRRVEVAAERLLDDDPPPAALVALVIQADAARDCPRSRRRPTAARRGRRPGCRACRAPRSMRVEPLGQRLVGRRVGEVAAGGRRCAPQARPRSPCPRAGPGSSCRGRSLSSLAERLVRVRATADRDDGELVRQQVRAPQLEQRGHDLAVREVAGGAEEHEDRRVGHALHAQAFTQRVSERSRWCRLPLRLRGQAQLPHGAGASLRAGDDAGAAGLAGTGLDDALPFAAAMATRS